MFDLLMMQSARRASPLKFSAPLTASLALTKGSNAFTFSRASAEWYWDDTGAWQTASNGTAAFNSKGVFLEPARTNKVTGYNIIPADTLGAEKVNNGGFNTDLTGWTGTNWAWETDGAGGGRVRHTAGSAGSLSFTISGSAGRVYEVTYTIGGVTAGGVQSRVGSSTTPGPSHTANGTYTERYVLAGTTRLDIIPGSTFNGYIDDVSVKEAVLAIGTVATSTNSGAVTGMTPSGDAAATLSVVDGTAAIVAGKAQNLLPSNKLYKLDNTSGSTDAFAAFAGTVGNTNPHSLSILAYKTAGTPQIQLSAAEGPVDITGATLARYTSDGVTPGTTGRTMRVKAPAGAVVYFVAFQLEQASAASSPIITTGATASRSATSLTASTTSVFRSASCSGTFSWTPAMSGGAFQRWLWASYTDVNNCLCMYYDGTNLVLRKMVAGVTSEATIALATVAGTTYSVGWRVNADRSLDIFLNHVKGTGNANTTAAVIAATFAIGDDGNGANGIVGQINDFKLYLAALADGQM